MLAFSDIKIFDKKLKANRKRFLNIVRAISKLDDYSHKEELARQGIYLALSSSTGYFASPEIEKVFIDIAQKNDIVLRNHFKRNSILHVMTECYATGGHTRVVERWINFSPLTEEHSLIFTENEEQDIPPDLSRAIEDHNGTITMIPDALSDIEKGLMLRKIASNYERVILHVHQHDVIPLIAFGHKDFKRPVFFFNHSDHKFWVGVSIADVVVNFRSWGDLMCRNRRGVSNSFVLGLPLDLQRLSTLTNKDKIRDELNLPTDAKIIITVGSAYKYNPFLSWNFNRLIKRILTRKENIIFVAIGSTPDIFNVQNERLICLGEVSPSVVFKYLHAADVYIDSYPMAGGTALMDAISCGLPSLSLECPVGHLDFMLASKGYCTTELELFEKLDAVLSSASFADELLQDITDNLNKYISKVRWLSNISSLYQMADEHHVVDFVVPNVKKFGDLERYLLVTGVNNDKSKVPGYIKCRCKLFVYLFCLILAQIPVVDLLFKKKRRQKLLNKVMQYWR